MCVVVKDLGCYLKAERCALICSFCPYISYFRKDKIMLLKISYFILDYFVMLFLMETSRDCTNRPQVANLKKTKMFRSFFSFVCKIEYLFKLDMN